MFDLLSRRVKARNIRFRISFRLLICKPHQAVGMSAENGIFGGASKARF